MKGQELVDGGESNIFEACHCTPAVRSVVAGVPLLTVSAHVFRNLESLELGRLRRWAITLKHVGVITRVATIITAANDTTTGMVPAHARGLVQTVAVGTLSRTLELRQVVWRWKRKLLAGVACALDGNSLMVRQEQVRTAVRC